MTLEEAQAQFFEVRLGRREDFGRPAHPRRPFMLVVVREEGGDVEVFTGPDEQGLLDELDTPRQPPPGPPGPPEERIEERLARLEQRIAQLERGRP